MEGDRIALLKLPAAGLSTPEVITLAQLIAFVAYQVRVVAGLQAMAAMDPTDAAAAQTQPDEPTAPNPPEGAIIDYRILLNRGQR